MYLWRYCNIDQTQTQDSDSEERELLESMPPSFLVTWRLTAAFQNLLLHGRDHSLSSREKSCVAVSLLAKERCLVTFIPT